MLISYKNRFIFIHNYKVAGISINIALRDFSINNPTLSPVFNSFLESVGSFGFFLNRIIRKIPFIYSFDEHVFASDVKEKMSAQIWQSYFKFGIVRNPWDWQVSLYHYILEKESHWAHNRIKECGNFENYIETGTFKIGHKSQHQFFTDDQGNLLVDYVAKLEKLQEDMDIISSKIGIPIELSVLNKSGHKDYKGYYTESTRQIIADFYQKDILLFNYEF